MLATDEIVDTERLRLKPASAASKSGDGGAEDSSLESSETELEDDTSSSYPLYRRKVPP